ncbi:MAG: hypothetical protein U0746_19565 [Gemmataceae bacterium]
MNRTDASLPNPGSARWAQLALPAVAAAIVIGTIVWQLWPGPDDRSSSLPARPVSAADAKADALMAQSRDLSTEYLQLIARFPSDRAFDRALPDEVRRLTSELDAVAKQHLKVIDELTALPRESLSPGISADLTRHLTAALGLKEKMAQIADKLKQKLTDAPPPEKAKDG